MPNTPKIPISPSAPGFQLAPDTFELFYRAVSALKFPINVAHVLELRHVINQAVDNFDEPVTTPDYREFCDALQQVIDASGIESKSHGERLLRILTMIRHLHYAYSINARDEENRLKAAIDAKKEQRKLYRRYSFIYAASAAVAASVWVGMPEPVWTVQLLTLGLAVGAWAHVWAMPSIDRRVVALEQAVNELQRQRIKSIHWRLLVNKLSLVLGFKRDNKVEVFRMDDGDSERNTHPRVRH